MWVFDTCYYCRHPIFKWGPGEDSSLLMFFSHSFYFSIGWIKVWLTAQRPWPSHLWIKRRTVPILNAHGDALPFQSTYWRSTLLSCEAEMPAPPQTSPAAKAPKHGEIGCDISARVTDKRNWVLCRACLNTQHSQTKGKSKARCFRPIIISHKSQTSQDQCLWQHDRWVWHRECQEKCLLHLISPISYCEWDLGVFFLQEKSHSRCDEHYPVIMKGTPL